MSFLLRKSDPRKLNSTSKNKGRQKRALQDEEIGSDSDISPDEKDDAYSSDDEEESALAKRVRLAENLLKKVDEKNLDKKNTDFLPDNDADKQKEKAVESLGRLHRKVADFCSAASSLDSCRKIRAHRFSPICLVLTPDGCYSVSSSKDGTVCKYDLSSGHRLNEIKIDRKSETSINHKGPVTALAITADIKYLVTGGDDGLIKVWHFDSLTFVHDLKGHKAPITSLAIRRETCQLFSSSRDRSVKVWDLDQFGYIDTMFGHQDAVMSIDCLYRERAVSCGGQDRSVRMWKVADESQLVFNGLQNCLSIDCIRLINDDHFVSGGMDGSLCVWSIFKKKPVCVERLAHGLDGLEANWIISLATNRYTDLIASGSRDGHIRLWKVSVDYKTLNLHSTIPILGFVNDMSFSENDKQLVCAVGQEHKNGRWWKVDEAKNIIVVIPLSYNDHLCE